MKLSMNLCGLHIRCDGGDVHEPVRAQRLERPYQLPPHPNQGSKDFDGGITQWIKSSTNPNDNELALRPKLRVGTSLADWARGGDKDSVAGRLRGAKRVSPTGEANLPVPEGLAQEEYRALAGKRLRDAMEEGSEDLDLENLGLKVLPEQVGNLVEVQTMNLNYNMLGSLPSAIVRMVNLRHLEAGLNEIKQFPDGIGALRKLTHLDLSGNLLENVPKDIGDLLHLQTLCLDWNRLTSLPKELGRLQSLRVFNAGTNLLDSVPVEIGNLRQLRRVNLSLNPSLYSVPREWNDTIAGLVYLDLSKTNFTGFDKDLPLPRKMKVLNLTGTQTRTLPKSFGSMALVNPPKVDQLRTTNSSNKITVMAGDCNLAYLLAGESRIEGKTKAQIPKLAPMRHEQKRAPYTYADKLAESDSDDGEDLEHFLEFGAAAAAELEHVRRARQAAAARRPGPGRTADWAVKQLAEAALPSGNVAPNQFSRPWNNDGAGAVPWAPPDHQWGAATGWAGRGRRGPPNTRYPWASNSQQPMVPPANYGQPPMAQPGGYGQPPMVPSTNVGFQGSRAPLPPPQWPMGAPQYNPAMNPASTPFQPRPLVPRQAPGYSGGADRPAWAPTPTWTEALGFTRAGENFASGFTRASETAVSGLTRASEAVLTRASETAASGLARAGETVASMGGSVAALLRMNDRAAR